jgi:hypothetical protein
MSRSAPRRGGRKGQSHRATPADLRSYTRPPASEVTITRPDGSTEIVPAQKPRKPAKPKRPKGKPVCGMCGSTIEGKWVISRVVGPSKGKPACEGCEEKAVKFLKDRQGPRKAAKS